VKHYHDLIERQLVIAIIQQINAHLASNSKHTLVRREQDINN